MDLVYFGWCPRTVMVQNLRGTESLVDRHWHSTIIVPWRLYLFIPLHTPASHKQCQKREPFKNVVEKNPTWTRLTGLNECLTVSELAATATAVAKEVLHFNAWWRVNLAVAVAANSDTAINWQCHTYPYSSHSKKGYFSIYWVVGYYTFDSAIPCIGVGHGRPVCWLVLERAICVGTIMEVCTL